MLCHIPEHHAGAVGLDIMPVTLRESCSPRGMVLAPGLGEEPRPGKALGAGMRVRGARVASPDGQTEGKGAGKVPWEWARCSNLPRCSRPSLPTRSQLRGLQQPPAHPSSPLPAGPPRPPPLSGDGGN